TGLDAFACGPGLPRAGGCRLRHRFLCQRARRGTTEGLPAHRSPGPAVSHRALGEGEKSRALDATRRFEELAFFHVPCDELNGADSTGAFFTHQIATEGRVAVIGSSGAGKSSLVSAVLGPFAQDLPEHIV